MNCRSVQRQLSAERDGALAINERAALDSHLAGCADCRRFQSTMKDAAEAWRTTTAQVRMPDAELAWQAVRREIRSSSTASGRAAPWFSRWALPIGAAAALAVVAVIVGPQWKQAPVAPKRDVARADFVEVGSGSSAMVYVDDKSGWLVVWAADEQHPKSG